MAGTNTLFLPAGYELEIVADAISHGYVTQIVSGSQDIGYTTISASSTTCIGPFNESREYRIVSAQGSILTSTAQVGLAPYVPCTEDEPITVSTGPGFTAETFRKTANLYQSILTFDNRLIRVQSAGSSVGIGGEEVFKLPEGHLHILGTVSELTLTVPTGYQDQFTDSTPEGEIAIGSDKQPVLGPLTPVASSHDRGAVTPFTMQNFTATVGIPTKPALIIDGTAFVGSQSSYDIKNLAINLTVDAADIDDSAVAYINISGTIKISWILLGDY